MLPVLLPIVLVISKSEARLLLYPQSRSQLQVPALIRMSRRLSYADQPAAPKDESPDGRGHLRVLPDCSSCVGRISIPYIDQHIDPIQRPGILPDLVKGQE